MPNAPYIKRETRLVQEWLTAKHPTALQWKKVRLGPIPGSPAERIYAGIRRWVDIVFKERDAVYLVEAKMRPMPEGLAQLEIYMRLWPQTPEFSEFKDLPVRAIFLTTRRDPLVEGLAAEKGILFEVYSPPWVEEWWAEVIAKGKRH